MILRATRDEHQERAQDEEWDLQSLKRLVENNEQRVVHESGSYKRLRLVEPINRAYNLRSRRALINRAAIHRAISILPTNANLKLALDRLEEIMKDDEDYDDEFNKASVYSLIISQHWLTATALMMEDDFPKASISPSGDGGVRIEWFRPNRSVRLVIASTAEGMSFIHHREGRLSDLEPLVDGLPMNKLAEQLNWLIT